MAGQSKVSGDATIIGRETFVEGGTLRVSHDLRIDGDLAVDVESTARVVVSPTGRVRGTISALTLEIAGQVDGDVVVSDLLVVRAGALVNGAVRAGKLRIEEGANGSAKFLVTADFDSETDPEHWRLEAKVAMERAMAAAAEARRLADTVPSRRDPGGGQARRGDGRKDESPGQRGEGSVSLFRKNELHRAPGGKGRSTDEMLHEAKLGAVADVPEGGSPSSAGGPRDRRENSDRFW